MGTRRRDTIRNPLGFVCVGLGSVVFVAWAILLDTAAAYVGCAVLLLALRPSLTITSHGLTVSNILPRRYRWEEIREIDSQSYHHGQMMRLNVQGSHKWVWAVAVHDWWPDGWFARVLGRVRGRWQQATGHRL